MKKVRLFIICISLLSCVSINAQMKWNSRYQAYIDQYKDLAISQMLKYNIPASITLAQGLLESRAGMSELATKGNNHFGIKCHDWTGKTMYYDDDAKGECFRKYKNVVESYEDHSQFLLRPRYSKLFTLKRTNYKGWAHGLKSCGYATSPTYAKNLIELIELYKLYQYDSASKYDKFVVEHSGTYSAYSHEIYSNNNNYYLIVREGDTFRSLGKETHISYRKLAKYNERDKRDELVEGERIYLKQKQKKAEKAYRKRPHVVKDGDSMYSIAQYYGIRLENLYKMNHLSPYYSIKVGDVLRVR
ncbi:MAG: glucosaminidase domain-containing protein [Prevotella sp.]|nr:glucosaminidase domain-containing protein [Prevotella sp.]